MKIIIIGSKGFIGNSCRKYFLEQGWEVAGCDVVDAIEENYFFIDPQNPDYELVVKTSQAAICINASGSADVGFSLKYPERDLQLNVKNVERMLEAIRKYNSSCRFINFSSAAVYGDPQSLPVAESAAIHPLSPYGKHKLESEQLLKKYHNEHRLKTCSLRVFSAYGVGLKKQLFWDIYKQALAGKNISLFGTGNESRDFIFIDDLVKAIHVIIDKANFCGEAINVSSGVETNIKDAAAIFLSCLGNDFNLSFSGEVKTGDPKNWRADISTLRQMGFAPFVNFDQGIIKYAAWLKGSGSE